MINSLVSVLFVALVVLIAYVAFLHGRNYERKQFVRVGKRKQPTVQDMVFKKGK